MVLRKTKHLIYLLMLIFVVLGLGACNSEKSDLKLGIYKTDDNDSTICLYDENEFTFIIVYNNYQPSGTYKIANGKLILPYTVDIEVVLEIDDDKLILIGANVEGVFVEDGPMPIGTVFEFRETTLS